MAVSDPLYANLLPELLLSLVGSTGDVFVAGGQAHIQLAPAVDWVSPADREVLNTLCRLGALYADLSASLEAAASGDSLYARALANGVAEVLDVYRLAVLQVEQHLLHFPAPPLLTLQQFLAEFQVLLPEVHQVVGEVQARRLSGARLMQLLAARARSGMPAVQSCASRLLWHCYQVMFKQLESWLVHGLLLDSGGEFFIQRAAPEGAAGGAEGGAGASPSPLSPVSGTAAARAPQDWDPLEWHAGFEVSVAALPPGISLPTAETVLFIGKAVRVLKQPAAAAGAGAAVAAAAGQVLRANAELLAYCDELHELQQREEFRPADFERLVERMRGTVAGLLWGLVLHRSDLVAHLASMRNYFLLGRGDFYQQFLDEAEQLLRSPPKLTTAEADAALLFQQASLKSTAETDPFFSHWHLRWAADPQLLAAAGGGSATSVSSSSAAQAGSGPGAGAGPALPAWHPSHTAHATVPALDAWDGLFLESTVDWPLQLLFPPEVLSKYGAMWQYLFRLRRVELALEEAWGTLAALAHPAAAAGGAPRLSQPQRTQLWQLRQRMTHFIHNLQMYLQVDVIDSRFALLREQIAAARDFMEADAAHRAYVDSLAIQAFLDLKQLMQIVEAVFGACMRLAAVVQDLAAGGTSEAEAAAALKEAGTTFRLRFNLLLTLLQSNKLQSASRAPAVRQLLLRLNFNDFNSVQLVRGPQGGAGRPA